MFSSMTSYSLPRWPSIRWLTHAGQDVPADIRTRLIASFFTSTVTLVIGAIANMAVNVVAVIRHPTLPFITLLATDIALLVGRMILLRVSQAAVKRDRSTPTDLFLLSSILWSALVGLGTALCFATADPVLRFLAPTAMMGIVGGVATRNNGAPRLAVTQVILCDVPFQFIIPFAGEPWMFISVAQCPMLILSLISTIHRLNRGYVAVVMAERDSERRATHDTLTGLLNRAGLMAALARDLRESIRQKDALSVLYLDLDGFKDVNDRFGHAAGDELLRQVAGRMVDHVPERCLSGRIGGDEFVILAPRCDLVEAKSIGEALVQAACQAFEVAPGIDVRIGASIGVACALPEMSVEALLADADAALYRAKMDGKGRCVAASAQGDQRRRPSKRLAA